MVHQKPRVGRWNKKKTDWMDIIIFFIKFIDSGIFLMSFVSANYPIMVSCTFYYLFSKWHKSVKMISI